MDYLRYCCFGIGLVLLVYGVFVFFRRKVNRNAVYVSALIEFASYFVLLIPCVYSDTPSSGVRGIESLLATLLVSITKYRGEGYERFPIDSATPAMTLFNSCYNIAIIIANLLMLVFAADIILHLIEGPYQELKLVRRRKHAVYLFSECNEKTLAIASSVPAEEKAALVFATSDDDVSEGNRAAAVKLDAVMIPQSVSDVFNRINGRAETLKVFLFNGKEEKNLQQMSDIGSSKIKKSDVKIYAEVNATPWSLYDDFIEDKTDKNDKLTINLVRTEENYIYNLLIEQSIFDNAVVTGKDRKINIVILGFNDRNFEFLKAVLHLGQMPGFELSVVLIEDGDSRALIRQKMPELYAKGAGYGDAIYSFTHLTGITYDSAELDDIIASDYGDFTFAFVNVGDDIRNINLALRLNAVKCRSGVNDGFKIISNVSDKEYCSRLSKKLIGNIVFDGDIETVYDQNFITMSAIEDSTIKIHIDRYGAKKTWKEYCNKEYNRHSVYARTLSFAYKVKFIDENPETAGKYEITTKDLNWKVYEHMRWDMYTRSLGYTKAPAELIGKNGKVPGDIRAIAKVHDCLVFFDELPEEEKPKDALDMKPDTIAALKSLLSSSQSRR